MSMQQRNFFLIYNPSSGKRRISQELETVITSLSRQGGVVTACPVLPGREPTALLSRLPALPDAVVCCGGDGTLHHTVNGLVQAGLELPVGYLPFGSTNDFAATLGLRRSLEANCAAISRGRVRPLDIGRFCDQTFCYVAAFGLFTDVSYQTPQNAKNLLGHFAYILEGALRLNLTQSWNARVTVDGQVLEGDFWYVSVSNATSIGGMAFPDQQAVVLDDGKFEVLLVRRPQNLADLHRLASDLLAAKFDGGLLHLLHGSSVRVESDAPISWTLDGEEGPATTCADIEVLPQRLSLLA